MVWHAWFGERSSFVVLSELGRASDCFFLTVWSVSDFSAVERLPLGVGLFHSPRACWRPTRTHPHTRHASRHSLSLSSCKHSLVSRFLSVASLASCLSCLSCLLSVLFCFCLASVLCLCCLVFVFPPSVRLSVRVHLCLSVCGMWSVVCVVCCVYVVVYLVVYVVVHVCVFARVCVCVRVRVCMWFDMVILGVSLVSGCVLVLKWVLVSRCVWPLHQTTSTRPPPKIPIGSPLSGGFYR